MNLMEANGFMIRYNKILRIVFAAVIAASLSGCALTVSHYPYNTHRAGMFNRDGVEGTKWVRQLRIKDENSSRKYTKITQKLSIGHNQMLLRTYIGRREYRKVFDYKLSRGTFLIPCVNDDEKVQQFEFYRTRGMLTIENYWDDDCCKDDIIYDISGEWERKSRRVIVERHYHNPVRCYNHYYPPYYR